MKIYELDHKDEQRRIGAHIEKVMKAFYPECKVISINRNKERQEKEEREKILKYIIENTKSF